MMSLEFSALYQKGMLVGHKISSIKRCAFQKEIAVRVVLPSCYSATSAADFITPPLCVYIQRQTVEKPILPTETLHCVLSH